MPAASSDLPESRPGKPVAFCLVLLRMGFTCAPPVARRAVVSYSAFPPLPHGIPFPGNRGRYISVALALESPPPDVIRHPALRSPDFPRLQPFGICSRDRLSYLTQYLIILYKNKKSHHFMDVPAIKFNNVFRQNGFGSGAECLDKRILGKEAAVRYSVPESGKNLRIRRDA